MKVLLLAGEESGLLYADAIRARLGDAEVRGYADYGFETADLAVIGFWAVLRRIFYFLRVKRTMERAIDAWRPDVVCTVDYPGMNLKLAAYAKRRGIRAVHVVCPQVWAWKQGRIPKIEASLDALACFLPFEPSLFRPGFATFVGHPLAAAFAAEGNAVAREPGLVALLPGSRVGEIERILPTLLEAAAALGTTHPGLRFEIPAANARARALIDRFVSSSDVPVTVRDGGARNLLRRADAAVVASGTATLEAAFAHCPTALVYRAGRLLAFIMRRLLTGTRFLGLANIVWDRCAAADGRDAQPMPELLQEDFTGAAVVAAVSRWLDDAPARDEAVRRLDAAVRLLDGDGDPIGRIVALLPAPRT